MKKQFLTLFILLAAFAVSSTCQAQSTSELKSKLDSLKTVKKSLESELADVQAEIRTINRQLSKRNVTTKPVASIVYVTNSGKKYHRSTCRYLRKSKSSIDLSRAKAGGYTACKVCKP